ncbi:MAG TPA: alpha/beta fold hydrolase [Rhodocyclaceae bacterium]|nr:alpha/beta fold hydrolase [Rhodocyclaceae bacterium]
MNGHGIHEVLGPNGFFEKRGETAVLLIHGLTGTPAEMRHFGRHLARKGLTVACPQLAGHCDSVQTLKASTWEDWYDSVDRAFEALTKECRQVHVAGLSMGALLGLLLAARKKERLAGVTLLSPTFFYDGWNMPKWRRRLLLPLVVYSPLHHFICWEEPPPYGIKDERVRAMVASVLESRDARTADKIGHFKTPATVIRESMRLVRATKKSLADVHRPTLVVHSLEDDMASIKNAHFVASRIASRQVETYFVDDSYHVLTLDKRKDDIADRVASFCASSPA